MALFGSMAVAVVGDTSKFNKAMDDAGSKTSSFGDKFGKVASGIGKAAVAGFLAAGAAFTALAVKSLNAGGALEQSIGGVETMFKSSSEKVVAYAQDAYKTAGLSANSYMEQVTSFSASLLQGLGGDTEKAADIAHMAMIDMSDNANKFGTDMASIQNAYQGFAKQNYTMLDNLKLGYGGTKTEMERLLADAEKLTGVKYDINNFSDVIEAIHTVQDNLGVTGTTAKEAMDTLSGSLGTAKAAFANFMDGSGGVGQLVDSVSNAMSIVVDRLKSLLPRLTTGLTTVVKKLLPQVPGIIGDLLPAIVEGAINLTTGFIAVIPRLLDTILGIFPTALKSLAQGLGEAVPILTPLTDAISFLADNFDKVLLYLTPLIAGIIAYNAVVGISAAIQQSSVIATIADAAAKVAAAFATGGLTAAITALNAVMALNPVGLMVAGIVALTAAVVGVIMWINKDTDEQKALKQATEDLVMANDDLADSISNSKKTYEDNAKGMAANEKASKSLVDKIYELSAAENKSAKDKERLALYVNQLNGLMPELNLQYDKEADALNMTREATEGLIAAKAEEVKQQAAQERAVELAKEQMETEQLLNETTMKRIEIEARKAEGLDRNIFGAFTLQDQLDNLISQEAELTATLESQETQFNALTETMVESTAKQAEATDTVTEHIKSAQEIQAEIAAQREASEEAYTQTLIEQANQWGMTLDEYKDHLKELEEEEKRAAKEREDALKKYTDAATDMFGRINTESKISVKEMTENLEANQAAIAQWSENLVTLAEKGVDEGLLEQLRTAGPESAATVNALVSASDTELSRLSTVFENGSTVAKDALMRTLGLPEVTNSGSKMVDDIASGVTNNASLETASSQLIQDAKTKMDSTVATGDFSGIGANMIQGVINGIISKASELYREIVSVANSAAQKARDALKIQSPSKIFEGIGQMTGQGFIVGIEAMSEKAMEAMGEMVSVPTISPHKISAQVDASLFDSEPVSANTQGITFGDLIFQIQTAQDPEEYGRRAAAEFERRIRYSGALVGV